MADERKSCVQCGVDLAGAKRFKDKLGQYWCQACADRKGSTRVLTPPPLAPPERTPAAKADELFALADEEGAGAGGTGQAAQSRDAQSQGPRQIDLCPECGRPQGKKSKLCVECGYNRETGETLKSAVHEGKVAKRKSVACEKCGYDLTGLRSTTCPECGLVNKARWQRVRSSTDTLKTMYLKPLIMMGVALPIYFIAMAVVLDSAVMGLAFGGGVFFARWIVGAIVYIACSMMFIGFDEPFGVTFMRLGAVFAIVYAFDTVCAAIGVPRLIVWPLSIFIYLGLMMSIMEIDLQDAWIVIVATGGSSMLIGFVLLMAFG